MYTKYTYKLNGCYGFVDYNIYYVNIWVNACLIACIHPSHSIHPSIHTYHWDTYHWLTILATLNAFCKYKYIRMDMSQKVIQRPTHQQPKVALEPAWIFLPSTTGKKHREPLQAPAMLDNRTPRKQARNAKAHDKPGRFSHQYSVPTHPV